MSADDGRDHETLGGEYALGLLTPAERRAVERRMRAEPALARDAAGWEERLQPLLDGVSPVSPPARLWQAIEEELGPAPSRAPAEAALRRPAVRPRGRRVAAFWQWLAIGALGLAAASLAGLALDLRAPAGSPMAASIAPANGAPLFVALVDPEKGEAMLMPVALGMDGDRVPELWLVPADGAPISLGVVDPSRPLRVDLKTRDGMGMGMMQAPGAALAVSMEPQGGSPTGSPTGPVVGQGMLHAI